MASVDVTALSIRVESTGVRESSQALGGLSTSAMNAEKRINSLVESLKKLQAVSATISTTTGSTAALTAALTTLNNTLVILNQRTQQADITQRRHNEGMREAHALARGLSGSLGALWLTYGNLAGMLAGLAVGSGLKAIFVMGKDIEHTLEGIRVKGMESVDSINKLRESILDLGTGIYGPREVAKAFDTLIMAGLNAQQAMTGMKDALNLALIGGTSIEKAAFTLVQVGTALGYTAEGYGRVGDVIAKTAAVSMSSVESLSEAFKSGSVVGKLYGISIQDIGTSFAALSNLGIRGSAAGTSLKNMYKELAADSDKLKDTLNLIGLKPQQLKDAEGNFKPLVELFSTLDQALGRYTAAEQKTLIARMANERGMKSLVELLSLYREQLQSSGDGTGKFTSRLEAMNKAINESFGFMAQGAAAMALTVDSQFKSVGNTLQVSLIKAFQDIQPQLSLVARNLKQVFGSEEFGNGVKALALGVANLTVFLVNNAEAVWNVIRAFLAFKAASAVLGILTGIATGLVAVKAAFDVARISAIAFQASLGLLGVALAAGAALLVWWATKRDEATTKKADASLNYMDDFADKIEEENKRLEKQIDLMQAGASATEAYVQAQQKLQLQKVQEQGGIAVGNAKGNLDSMWKGFNNNQRAGVSSFLGGQRDLDMYDGQQMVAIKNYTNALKEYNAVKDEVNKKEARTAKLIEDNIVWSRAAAELADKQARERGKMPGGTETIPEEVKKAAINAMMNADLARLQEEIDRAKRQASQEKENAQSAYRQGMIGELSMIERIREAEANRQAITGEAAAKKIKVLSQYANQESAIAQEQANVRAALAATQEAAQDAENKRMEYSTKLVQDTQKAQAEAYVSNGQFVAAFEAEQGRRHDIETNRLIDNMNNATDALEMFRIAQLLAANEAAKAAGVKAAANKEAENSFNLLADATRNSMKGIQTANEGQGLAAMFMAAKAASVAYAAELPNLQARMADITNPKDIEEANARMINLAETQRKMWVGVGESISNSLEKAFGKSGKAAGDLVKIAVDYNNLEKKTSSARVKAYGDAASAAKGFFKEGTTGYELMEKAEQAFRIVELAGMAKSLATTISTSAAKATAMIPEFMMAWGSLGPWGYAAGAVAIAAILGASAGGSSAPMSSAERQKTQGTGSVFGSDEKSASIANSLEIMEKNSGLGLVHSNEMVKHLRTLATSISGLANLVVRSTGITGSMQGESYDGLAKLSAQFDGALGLLGKFAMKISNAIFGGKVTALDTGFTLNKTNVGAAINGGLQASQFTDTKKDGGLFRSDKYSTSMTSLGADANSQFSKIIADMSRAITSAADSIGFGGDAFTAKLKTFVIDIGKISLKDLDGAQIKEQLEAVFSKLGDDMAKFALAGFEQFQQVGEGYLETIARLANDLIQVKDVFAVLNKTFALTGMAAINVSENLIAAAGGLENLTDGTKYFVDNFLTEAERMAPISASVAKRMKELNQGDVTSIEMFKQRIRALDLTNAADQQLYAALIEIAPAFKEAADYAEELADGVTKLSKAQQKALDAVNKARDNLQASYDKESSALQSTIDKTKAFIQTLKNYQDSLKLGADSPLTNMEKYAEARRQFDATALAAKNGDQAAKDKLTGAASALLNASKIINASSEGYTSDFNMVQNMLDALIGSAGSEVSIAQASLNALNQQVAGLLKIDESVLSVTQAIKEFKEAVARGTVAGLTPQQMDTDYVPTAAELAAATPVRPATDGGIPGALVGTIQDMKASFDQMRAEQERLAAMQIKAMYDSTQRAADSTNDAIGESSQISKSNQLININ